MDIRRSTATVNGVRLHYLEAGSGPPVYLLHGFPETSYAWRKQVPVLAEKYHVVAPDLRGYGHSEKPAAGYDKRSMAKDIYELMTRLGHSKIALVGHDRGARVATRFCKDYPQSVDRVVMMDNVPTRFVLSSINSNMLRGYWFFYFHQIADLPEALIHGKESLYIRHFLREWCFSPEIFSEAELQVYDRAYSAPGGLRGALSDYRAAAIDWDQDQQDADQLIACPTLVLWGADFEWVGKMVDMNQVWNAMALNMRGVAIPQCGHLPHEEQPEIVNRELIEFLSGWTGQ
ncbi:alpha/beta fold hydrolase [Mesorhizobium sp. NZP2298]|uniref:alpha/beta fold hydrolase n=1 Tax=Mesorhizobium sp. NZP2298 TaxID=2483403 RepID=UPI001556FA10|nr:alpha/beta hydrolase [Mesorhizobium sp. NZP2298]QKC98334.1 alpha/beta hydrolase [Mesorhizobium sp. NZP2298]